MWARQECTASPGRPDWYRLRPFRWCVAEVFMSDRLRQPSAAGDRVFGL